MSVTKVFEGNPGESQSRYLMVLDFVLITERALCLVDICGGDRRSFAPDKFEQREK
jgi:hypothetical protein